MVLENQEVFGEAGGAGDKALPEFYFVLVTQVLLGLTQSVVSREWVIALLPSITLPSPRHVGRAAPMSYEVVVSDDTFEPFSGVWLG